MEGINRCDYFSFFIRGEEYEVNVTNSASDNTQPHLRICSIGICLSRFTLVHDLISRVLSENQVLSGQFANGTL